jgi:hypothetical protein
VKYASGNGKFTRVFLKTGVTDLSLATSGIAGVGLRRD